MQQPTISKTLPRKRVTTTAPVEVDTAEEIAPGVWEVADEEEGSRIVETPPKIPTPSVSDQVKATAERLRALPDRIRKTASPKKVGVKRPRTSVEGFISAAWNIGARMLQPVAWPVSNVLALQSPIAGKILEDVVKDTVADTVLQPFARVFKGGDTAFALLGPPILVGVACARPDSQKIIEPLLREALKSWLTVAGPKMIEKAKEEKAFQEEYGETIDGMIEAIFTPPPGMMVETPDEPNHREERVFIPAGQTS